MGVRLHTKLPPQSKSSLLRRLLPHLGQGLCTNAHMEKNTHHKFSHLIQWHPGRAWLWTAWEYVFSSSDVVEHVLLVLDWASTSCAARKRREGETRADAGMYVRWNGCSLHLLLSLDVDNYLPRHISRRECSNTATSVFQREVITEERRGIGYTQTRVGQIELTESACRRFQVQMKFSLLYAMIEMKVVQGTGASQVGYIRDWGHLCTRNVIQLILEVTTEPSNSLEWSAHLIFANVRLKCNPVCASSDEISEAWFLQSS